VSAPVAAETLAAAARQRLVAHLLTMMGPAATTADATKVLIAGQAWVPRSARRLDAHLREHPDAFVAPSGDCPAVLVRVTRVLARTGHGQVVTQLGCARCGRTDDPLPRVKAEGRCCANCAARETTDVCVRCQVRRQITARGAQGPICDRCYATDPARMETCARCGRIRRPAVRHPDGAAWCGSCSRRPRPCVRCGALAQVEALTSDGPVCRKCHQRPGRACGVCGQVKAIHVRATGDQPDVCASCYRSPVGTCTVCRRERHGATRAGGAFYCDSCQPRPVRPCQDCGRTRATKVSGWPIGVLCNSCYSRRKRYPRPCAGCGRTKVVVGRGADGELCGPCCGVDELDFVCPRCAAPGQVYADGACARCVLRDRLVDLFGASTVAGPAPMQPVIEALAAADNPNSILSWLTASPSVRLLVELARTGAEVTHAALDTMANDATTRHVRQTLVATGILSPRQENLAALALWSRAHVDALPARQARIIRPFAEWQVMRDARRRASRGRYSRAAAAHDRTDIRVATEFVQWLEDRQLELDTLTQGEVDLWLTTHPTRHRRLTSFIAWTSARRLTGPLRVPAKPAGLPANFQTATEHHDQLRRCLNDTNLPRVARITGALIRLYALPISRIHDLTIDKFHRDADRAYLTIDRFPVLLPPKLAAVIEEQIHQPTSVSILAITAADRRYLMPGRPPHRPIAVSSLHKLLSENQLPTLVARNTAMIESVSALPPIVIADLFGVATSTAHRWAQYAQDSWADYLATTHALAASTEHAPVRGPIATE
jgi:hypothetical protein